MMVWKPNSLYKGVRHLIFYSILELEYFEGASKGMKEHEEHHRGL